MTSGDVQLASEMGGIANIDLVGSRASSRCCLTQTDRVAKRAIRASWYFAHFRRSDQTSKRACAAFQFCPGTASIRSLRAFLNATVPAAAPL
jgi:hypothetical protein